MFKENFERLCNRINKAPTTVCQEIGLSNAVYAKWNEKSIPHRSTLIKIADYFGVTPELLVAENEQKKAPSEMDGEEKILFIKQKYSRLTEDERKALEQFADYLLDKREKTSQGDSDNQ